MEENQPFIVDIKRNSLDDGQGIRSVVFLKGCPLSCIFCHNPETQDPYQEIAFSESECIQCHACYDVCPEGAIKLDSKERINREKCTRCLKCADICPGSGLRKIGTHYSVDELVQILLRDIHFYNHSQGGVTLSGGECTLYPLYLNSLLKKLKKEKIHIAIQTSGYFEYEIFKQYILPYVDLIFYDIKIADPKAHLRYIGKSNGTIISNLTRVIRDADIEIQPRIPLIPGITATAENLRGIIQILIDSGAEYVSLLPYNPLGFDMAEKIGKSRPNLPSNFMNPREEDDLYSLVENLIKKNRRMPH